MAEDVPDLRAARPPVPWRTILAAIGAAAGTYVAWLLVGELRDEITWMVVAGFFAVILTPPVDLLVHRLHLRRTLAAFIVFVIGFGAVGGLGYLFIRPVVGEVTKFVNQFPALVKNAEAGRGPVGHLVKKYNLVQKAQQYSPKVQQYLSGSGSQALSLLRKIGNGVVSFLTILVLTFLLLVEGPKMLEGAVGLLRPDRQERIRRLGRNSSRAITGYMAGNLLISLIAGIVTYCGLWAFGVPFREVAAVWVAFADLVPLIGATLGAIPTVGLAFLHSVPAGIGMIVIYIVYQQFENHVLQVTIMARTVRLSPLAVLLSLLAGVQLFGLLGALLAIPVAAILHIISVDIYRERRRQRVDEAMEEATQEPAIPELTNGHAGATAPRNGASAPTPADPAPPAPERTEEAEETEVPPLP
jgi:predicted PurR-regulated permease PerM